MSAEISKTQTAWEISFPKSGNAPMLAFEWLADSDIETYIQFIKHDSEKIYVVMDVSQLDIEEFRDYINTNM